MERFEDLMRRGGDAALQEASRFFMKEDRVHVSLRRIAKRLEDLRIPYVIVGGMALVAHGYDRTTEDVDLLVTSEGLAAAHAALEGLGYVAPFKGSKELRDVDSNVRIEFLVTGQFPGDGKPKPVAFPDPAAASVEIDGIRFARLETIIELKLASGMSNAGRVKDLGDVQELIRVLKLPESFGEKLNEYVRGKYLELWEGLRAGPVGE